VGVWQGISNGQFLITIDGIAREFLNIDLTSITNLSDVASIIQTTLRGETEPGFSDAIVTFDDSNIQFTITSGSFGLSSSVSDLSDSPNGTGTDISELLGLNTGQNVPGFAATVLRILGVTFRNVVHQSFGLKDSGSTGIVEGQVGVFLAEGTIKVLAKENANDGSDVFFDNTTGEIYFTGGTNKTKLADSKLRGSATEGKVAIIDVIGVRAL
jgi:hypothetical protein